MFMLCPHRASFGFPFVPIVRFHVFFFSSTVVFVIVASFIYCYFSAYCVCVCVCFFITPQAKIFCAYTKFAPSTNYLNNTEVRSKFTGN